MTNLVSLEWWFELGAVGLSSAMHAGFTAGLLLLVVLPAHFLLRRRVSAGALALLWSVVLLRLALPVVPGSHFSLEAVFDRLTTEPPAPLASVLAVPDAADLPVSEPVSSPGDLVAVAGPSRGFDLETLAWILVFVWMAGLPLGLAITLGGHWRFTRRLRGSPATDDPRLLALWNECRLLAEVGRAIPVVVTDTLAQPALHGLLRPRLLLPESAAALSDDQLRMVMLHELAHVRRRDVAINWGLALLRMVHWWNPVFWLAAGRFAALREEACDAFSLRRLAQGAPPEANRDRAVAYGELLLALAARNEDRRWGLTLPASLLGFALWSRVHGRLRQWSLAARLRSLPRATRPMRWWQAGLFTLLFVTAAACGLTKASIHSPQEDPFEWTPSIGQMDPLETEETRSEDPGPKTTRVYAVAEIVRRWSPLLGGDAAASDELRLRVEAQLQARASIDKRSDRIEPPLPAASGSGAAVTKVSPHCALVDGQLIVVATAGTHDRIAALLKTLESSRPNQVVIECRILTGPYDLAYNCGIRWSRVATGDRSEETLDEIEEGGSRITATTSVTEALPIAVGEITEAQTGLLIYNTKGSSRSNVMFAPKITLFPAMEGTIFSGVERPFVVGVSQSGRKAVPQITHCPEGTHLRMRALPKAGSDLVRMQCRLRLTQVVHVRTFSTRVARTDTTVQIPSLRAFNVNVDREVREGHTLLIGCPPAREGEDPTHVLLTPRVLPVEAANP